MSDSPREVAANILGGHKGRGIPLSCSLFNNNAKFMINL